MQQAQGSANSSVFSDHDTAPVSPAAAPGKSLFADHDSSPAQGKPEQDPHTEDLKQRNAIEPAEVDAIGAKHGLSKDQTENLKSIAPYLGAHMSDKEEGLEGVISGAKEAVGLIGRAGLNAPQWLAKQVLSPNERAAWDEVQELADSRKSGSRRAAETVGEMAVGGGLLKGLGAAKSLAGAAATGAAVGGVQGAFSAKEGEGVKGTVTGAVVGGVLGAGMHGAIEGAKALYSWARTPEAAGQVERIAQKVTERLQSPEEQQAAKQGLDSVVAQVRSAADAMAGPAKPEDAGDLVQFANHLENPGSLPKGEAPVPKAKSYADALQTVREFAGTRGDQALEQAYQGYRAAQVAAEEGADYAARGGGVLSNRAYRLGRSVLRARAQFGIIDDRNPGLTNFESHSDSYALAKTSADNEVASKALGLRSQWKALQSEGVQVLTPEQLSAARKGDLSSFTVEQAKALQEHLGAYEDLRKTYNARVGDEVIPAPARGKNYIPDMQADAGQTSQIVRRTAQAASDAAGVDLLGRDVSEADLARLKEAGGEHWGKLQEQLEYLGGEGYDAENPRDVQRILTQAVDPQGADTLSSNLLRGPAGVARARTANAASIPESLRETDMVRLQVKWMKQAFTDAYTAPVLRDMATDLSKLRAVNDRAGVEYVEQFLRDQAGGSDTLPKAAAQMRAKFMNQMSAKAEQAEREGNTKLAGLYKDLSGNADLAGLMVGSMYPNLLGLKPSTVMKAVMAPMVSSLPELAGSGNPAWAMAKMAGGAMRAAQKLAQGELPAAFRRLTEEGFMPAHAPTEAFDAFNTQFERSLPAKLLRAGVSKWSHVALLPLQMAESAARVLNIEAASSVAQDLERGSTSAQRFVQNLGAGYRQQIQDLTRAGRWDEVEQQLQKYMVGKTLHYYSPTQMSELGRSMGRWVSAFGTWPTAVVGDIVRDYARRGALGGSGALLRKQLAPLAALWMVQHYASAQGFDPNESPRAKALVGGKGLTGASPFGESLSRITKPMETPMVKDMGEGVAALVSGDRQKIVSSLNQMGSHFVPFAGLVPLIDTTIPALLLNRPGPDKGQTLPERAVDIARSIR